MSRSHTWALLFAATLLVSAMAMPQSSNRRTGRQVSTYAADRGEFYQDIFQIPIQALQAISDLVRNTAMRIQRRREAYETAQKLEEPYDKGTLRSG